MRLIDADKLKQDVLEWKDCPNGYSDTYDKARIISGIDEAPTIDAVPVVRCKDCMYADSYYHCTWANFWGTADDYCSRAKPKIILDEVNDEDN